MAISFFLSALICSVAGSDWFLLAGWELLSTSALAHPQCLQVLSLCCSPRGQSVVTLHCDHPASPCLAFLGWKTVSWRAVERSL